MNPIVHKAQQSQLRKDHPNFRPGDTVKINVRLKEGEGDNVADYRNSSTPHNLTTTA